MVNSLYLMTVSSCICSAFMSTDSNVIKMNRSLNYKTLLCLYKLLQNIEFYNSQGVANPLKCV